MTSVRPPRRLRARVVVPVVLIVFLAAIVTSAIAMGGPTKPNGLLTTTSLSQTPYPIKNLPPSHDNDAGRARVPDATPDNDTDASQRG